MSDSEMQAASHDGGEHRTGVLELDPNAFRELGYQAVDRAADYLARVSNGPVFTPMSPAEREAILGSGLPESGEDASKIIIEGAAQIFAHPMGNGHPRFFGWINSPPAPLGALADFLASVTGPSCAGGDHAATYLEHACVRWLKELIGFPTEGSGGLLVSGGSMASLTCLASAREWTAAQHGWSAREDGLMDASAQLVLYVSSETHTTIRKAAHLLGLGETAVRVVPTDGDRRIDLDALKVAIHEDCMAGKQPMCVVASAGTAATGAIDPINSIADICDHEQIWLHVDGAYGGFGIVDPAVSRKFVGLDRAASIAIDPHKWLSVPVECGCALVRDASLMRETFSLVPPYVRTDEDSGFGGPVWFSEFGFQQTRGFRALKLWMVLRQLGRSGVQAHIARCNSLARELGEMVSDAPDLELAAPVSLSIVCFRYRPSDWTGAEKDLSDLNKAIMVDVQSSGEAFITNAMLEGRFVLRACVLHYATSRDDLEALLEIVRRFGQRRLAGIRQAERES